MGARFVPSLLMVMKKMVISFKRSCACIAALIAPNPAVGHCWLLPPPETSGHSQLWGHCSFLLGSGVHKALFVPFKSLFSQSCVSSGGSLVWLMATSFRRAYATTGMLYPEPLPLWQATADPCLCRRHSNPQRQVWLSLCGVSWCIQGFVWALRASLVGMGLVLNVISPLLPSWWGFSFAFGHGVSFFDGLQDSSINSFSAASCNFGVFAGEEFTSFYSTILCLTKALT